MLKNIKCFVCGMIFTLLIMCVVVASSEDVYKEISVVFDNIRIVLNGEELRTTDVNGKEVEPFIYEGTTYVPIRAVAEAFDKNVDWYDGNSVVLISDTTVGEEPLAKLELCCANNFYITLYQNKLKVAEYDKPMYGMVLDEFEGKMFYITNEETEAILNALNEVYHEDFSKFHWCTISDYQPGFDLELWLKTEQEWYKNYKFIETEEGDYTHTKKTEAMLKTLREITGLALESGKLYAG